MATVDSDTVRRVRLFNDALASSEGRLATQFNPRLAPFASTQTPVTACHIFNIRTFPLPVDILKRILADWDGSPRYQNKGEKWIEYLEIKRPHDETMVYIRSTGMGSGGKTGLERFLQDLKKGKMAILSALFEAVETNHPQVFASCTVHEIVDAEFSDDLPYESSDVDEPERILIALFEKAVLLNQQGPGFCSSYTPLRADDQLSQKFETRFFWRFDNSRDDNEVSQYEVRDQNSAQWSEKLYEYAYSHPTKICHNRFPSMKQAEQNVVEPARPALREDPTMSVLRNCAGKMLTSTIS